MNPKVKEFIEAARAKERTKFEEERDAHLISLGLIKETVRKYSDEFGGGFDHYDKDLKKYYNEFPVPEKVTDEEYEEIKRITGIETKEINNGAEKLLDGINTALLIIGIFATIILAFAAFTNPEEGYFIAAIVVLSTTVVSWAMVRVLLNISNNLHQINSKLK